MIELFNLFGDPEKRERIREIEYIPGKYEPAKLYHIYLQAFQCRLLQGSLPLQSQ
jgi:hypothetical protein